MQQIQYCAFYRLKLETWQFRKSSFDQNMKKVVCNLLDRPVKNIAARLAAAAKLESRSLPAENAFVIVSALRIFKTVQQLAFGIWQGSLFSEQ